MRPVTYIFSFLAIIIMTVALILMLRSAFPERFSESASPPAAGPIDIGFAQSMSVHHQQAIAMAQLMLDGRPTPLAPLAQQIAYDLWRARQTVVA